MTVRPAATTRIAAVDRILLGDARRWAPGQARGRVLDVAARNRRHLRHRLSGRGSPTLLAWTAAPRSGRRPSTRSGPQGSAGRCPARRDAGTCVLARRWWRRSPRRVTGRRRPRQPLQRSHVAASRADSRPASGTRGVGHRRRAPPPGGRSRHGDRITRRRRHPRRAGALTTYRTMRLADPDGGSPAPHPCCARQPWWVLATGRSQVGGWI